MLIAVFSLLHKFGSYFIQALKLFQNINRHFVFLGIFPYIWLLSLIRSTEIRYFYSIRPPLSAGGQLVIPHLEKGEIKKKNKCLCDQKSVCHRYLPGGITMFLVKKKLGEIKRDAKGTIWNVDLCLACFTQTTNQLFW